MHFPANFYKTSQFSEIMIVGGKNYRTNNEEYKINKKEQLNSLTLIKEIKSVILP